MATAAAMAIIIIITSSINNTRERGDKSDSGIYGLFNPTISTA
jgi:hypothetical protein